MMKTAQDNVPTPGGAPAVAWKQTTIRVPLDVHRATKIVCAEEGLTMAELIESLLREYLNRPATKAVEAAAMKKRGE